MTEKHPQSNGICSRLSAVARQQRFVTLWRDTRYDNIGEIPTPVGVILGRNFRFWYLQSSEPSDILSLSHPSHRSPTKVMCNQDGFFYCLDSALSGRAGA